MKKLRFDHMLKKVLSEWPKTISGEKFGSLVSMEEGVSQKFIGIEYELLFRELSYSLMLVARMEVQAGKEVRLDSIDAMLVKSKFESRIGDWRVSDEGFTSDVEARKKYFLQNSKQLGTP